MAFYIKAQLHTNSNNFPLKNSSTHLTTKENINGNQKNIINELQKASSHVNFSSENIKLYSSFLSGINTTDKKVNSSSKPLLDSIVTKKASGINYQKEIYNYDNNGNDTTDVVYNWDSINSQWSIYSKIKTIKDINGLIISYESYTWLFGSYFIGGTKYVNTYNSSNKILTNTVYQWNILTSNWLYSAKTENTYDANQNLTTIINYSRDNTLNVWVNSTKSDLNYDTSNKLILETNSEWNTISSNWINSTKDEHNYNTMGNDTLVLGYTWDTGTSVWNTSNKIIYSYDSNSDLTGLELWDWNSTTNSWVGTGKEDFGFNANKQLIVSEIYLWDNTTSSWTGFSKFTISYYTTNHLEQFRITYTMSGGLWVENTEIESIYDGNNNLTIENTYNWNLITSSWNKIRISTYYYTFISTGDPSVNGQNMNIYPNPVSDVLQINGLNSNTTCSIIDINGKIVYKQNNIEKTIDVSSLKEGIYFLQITNRTGTTNYKFIKNH